MTARFFPPLPPELVAFAESGLSMLVGTRDAGLVPHAMRAMGIRIWPGASQLTVFLPKATGATAAANARANGQLAITMSKPANHETIQIKGTVREVREASESEREVIEKYRAGLADHLMDAGVLRQTTRRLSHWPAHAIDLDIAEVFAQTPGPGAGKRMTSP